MMTITVLLSLPLDVWLLLLLLPPMAVALLGCSEPLVALLLAVALVRACRSRW